MHYASLIIIFVIYYLIIYKNNVSNSDLIKGIPYKKKI